MISCITYKNDVFKQFKIKNVDEDNIFKKCGYKSSNNFSKLYTWKIDNTTHLELWSKVDNLCKVFIQHNIFSKYSINVNNNNKCIFLLKNAKDYINLDCKFFTSFFDLTDVIETGATNTEISDEHAQKHDQNHDQNNAQNNSQNNDQNHDQNNVNNAKIHKTNPLNEDYEVNSELSYELYNYSDEETYLL